MIRIKDVADYVGVSATTVSNVLHGRNQRVSQKTRQKIENALEEMGYIPSMGALMLAQEKSSIIGVILFNKGGLNEPTLTDPYYSSLVGYLDQYIKERKHYILMLTVSNVEEIVRQTKVWNLEGLIACNLQPDAIRHLNTLCQKPLVSIDAYLEDKSSYINIHTDDFGGGYQMGKYLVAMGHRNILMISDNDQDVDHHRWLGFKKAMEDLRIPVSEEQHLIVSNQHEERLVHFKKLERRFRQQTALFCVSDYYALEICAFLRGIGLRVPEDISVAGFDDLLYASLAVPKLTTIRQSIEQKARMAVDALFCLMNGEKSSGWLLSVELIERESVKRL